MNLSERGHLAIDYMNAIKDVTPGVATPADILAALGYMISALIKVMCGAGSEEPVAREIESIVATAARRVMQ